ncbi:MAG: BON domain-containing protein [Chloroflexi bacterium]|nr:BON domain-containing protein [Chloroflexota bacterium]
MTWGGTFPGMYTGQGWMYSEGMPSDDQIEDMIYTSIDADPSVPFDSEINIDVAGGVVTLSGTVPNKRVKHAVGDDAWWVPGVWDVNNNLAVTGHAQKPSTRTRAHRPSSGKGSTKGK